MDKVFIIETCSTPGLWITNSFVYAHEERQ